MEEQQAPFESSPYRISTNTATANIGSPIDLNVLYDNAPFIDLDAPEIGIVFMEYGHSKTDILFKGKTPNKRKERKLLKGVSIDDKRKRFSNQATTVIKIRAETPTYVNMKVFNNGKIQMTGLKKLEDGKVAIDCIMHVISQLFEKLAAVEPAVEKNVVNDPSLLVLSDYKIHLINSDFTINFEVKRELLHSLLVDTYHNKCVYEPCIYPGVKLQYYYPTYPTTAPLNGNCQCPDSACTGKKRSINCKKITIATFQSGCIIITGANCVEQLNACYEYIVDVLRTNMNAIKKKKFITNDTKKMWIKKSSYENMTKHNKSSVKLEAIDGIALKVQKLDIHEEEQVATVTPIA